MLRHKLSAGILRATAPTSTASPAVAGRARSRSLASAVLLSSQRNWKGETVVTLKAELKKRGLSQQGNKSSLIARLESADTSSSLGPLPPFPNAARSLSTSSAVAQPPKSKKPASAPAGKEVADETVTTTGAQVSSERHDHATPKAPAIEPELVTVAPGLPETKKIDTAGKETLDLKFPKPKAEENTDQVIPLTPDNYASSPVAKPTVTSEAPKILTVASASTHLSGGPVHGVHETVERAVEAAPSLKDLPSFSDAVGSVFSAPSRAWSSIGAKLPEVHLPPAPKEQAYKAEHRPLNSDEKRGAWLLAGVVGLGYLLGGGEKKGKGKGKAIVEGAEELANKARGVQSIKGDANWEKASGAGVVGHGTRKD